MDKRLIGVLGEKLVCKWYTDRKYKLLSVNYKTRQGEIDIIAEYKNTVVFVEVKTRKNNKFSDAREAVTYSKQQKIKAAAQQYISYHNLDDKNIRFDVAEVYHRDTKPEINIIENAFE